MAEDVSIALLSDIDRVFKTEMLKSTKARTIAKDLYTDKITYHSAYQYAKEIGNARAKAFKLVLNSDVLPDGKMYFNIAEKIIKGTLPNDHNAIAEISGSAQSNINKRAKIGLKTQVPKVDDDRLMGFINRLSSEELFDDVAWILEDPVKEFCSAVVDSTIKKNAEFHNTIGLKATLERSSNGGCCKYCDDLAGVYNYPNVPDGIFSRHDNCKCTIEYNAQKMNVSGHAFTR